jgi:hypothetical protein
MKKALCKTLSASRNKTLKSKWYPALNQSQAKKLNPSPWVAKPFGAAQANRQAAM